MYSDEQRKATAQSTYEDAKKTQVSFTNLFVVRAMEGPLVIERPAPIRRVLGRPFGRWSSWSQLPPGRRRGGLLPPSPLFQLPPALCLSATPAGGRSSSPPAPVDSRQLVDRPHFSNMLDVGAGIRRHPAPSPPGSPLSDLLAMGGDVSISSSTCTELFEANFIVVAIVSDMGTGNVALWRELNVGHDKNCHFAHPCDDALKIFVCADVPHLIKLVRNHLIDHSFYVDDYIINKDYFQALLKLSSTELIAHKLTQDHIINISGSARQRVGPAVQLLSNTVAKAITYAGGHRLMPKNSKEASAIVQLFNDWFDLMNSRSKFVISCPGRNAFGTDIEKQKELLHKMTEVINIIRVEKYKVQYVLTSRLNQDVLENLFSYIRGMGGSNDHPSSAIFTENRNTAGSTEPCFFNVLNEPSVETIQEDICITQRMLSNLVETDIYDRDASILSINTFEEPAYSEDESMNQNLVSLIDQFEIKEKNHMEALKYITGYVANQFKNKYELKIPTKK
nr:unnamed protein product [Callosobruchus chinensis]